MHSRLLLSSVALVIALVAASAAAAPERGPLLSPPLDAWSRAKAPDLLPDPGPSAPRGLPRGLIDRTACPDPAQAGTPARAVPVVELRKTNHAGQGTLSWAVSGLPAITAMSEAITRSVEANAVVFPGVRGPVSGFFPGRDYQELYIRDTASILLVAPYLYPDQFLRSVTEEFLFRQWTATAAVPPRPGQPSFPGPDATYGLIAPGGWADKSTATSDEEPSLVIGAYRYVRGVGGRAWLDCDIQGRTVLERLRGALDHLVSTRTDPATGLVLRAHTTDWGDVRMQGGPHPTQVDLNSETWTISIYDQAVIYLAMRQLAELHRLADDPSAARLWDQRADLLRQQTNRFLWQPGRGFYRTHLHATVLDHPFDEDQMVSIANAVAVYAGLTDEAQTRRIFDALENTRIATSVRKPGLAIFPPYAPGVFQHPNMNHWAYQNGALWDWWGAVQITGEFLHGRSERALSHLNALADTWQDHPGTILEWQDPFGGPARGSDMYAGAAGTAAEAVIRGLFGIELQTDGFALRPRLGGRDGFIQVQQPATGYALWARQRVQDGTLVLEYTVAHPGAGGLEVLLPRGSTAGGVLLDGSPLQGTVHQNGDDRYLVVGEITSGTHRLDVTLLPDTDPHLRVRWDTAYAALVLPPARPAIVPVTLHNAGPMAWKPAGSDALRVRARWLDKDRQALPELDALSQQIDLPQEVAPGKSAALRPTLRTPERPGDYWLRWEAQAGTDAAAGPPLEVAVRVTATSLGQTWSGFSNEATLAVGQDAQLSLTVENSGFETWHAEGATPVELGYRWYRSDGREVRFAGSETRIPLPRDVAPGETARLVGQVLAPPLPDRYLLRWDLKKGPGTWFSSIASNPTADISVQVVP